MNEGKVVSGADGRLVVDGPFAESKEAIGGYFLIAVADFDEAVAIAKQCPGLKYGAAVEIRPVAEEFGDGNRAASRARNWKCAMSESNNKVTATTCGNARRWWRISSGANGGRWSRH